MKTEICASNSSTFKASSQPYPLSHEDTQKINECINQIHLWRISLIKNISISYFLKLEGSSS